MKTPEEIKIWLNGCKDKSGCQLCYNDWVCKENAYALAYIQQLEQELATAKRERDAAVDDLNEDHKCHICVHADCQWDDYPCSSCVHSDPVDNFYSHFEWCGVCPENTEVQDGQSDA